MNMPTFIYTWAELGLEAPMERWARLKTQRHLHWSAHRWGVQMKRLYERALRRRGMRMSSLNDWPESVRTSHSLLRVEHI